MLGIMTTLQHDPSVDSLPSASLTGFRDLVSDLGGSAKDMLGAAGIAAAALDRAHDKIPWTAVAAVLEESARRLDCIDFGMRLAERQDALRLSDNLEQLYTNAPSLFEALNWTVAHSGAYTSAVRNTIQWDAELRLYVERFHFPDQRPSRFEQLVELLLLLSQNAIIDLTGGLGRAWEIWFSHRRLSSPARYRAKFGATVRFGQAYDALFYTEQAIHARAIDADKDIFKAERALRSAEFPPSARSFATFARETVENLLLDGRCSRHEVACALGTSRSGLHRKLQAAGTSFELLRDETRRSQALRYLLFTDLRLTDIAERLGYAEPAVFSRSFRRWFSVSPREARRKRLLG
jgi:AraC-like DNA-binding protein